MLRNVRTSESHPLQVFWVDGAAHATEGMLGLTFAPGKRGVGLVTGAGWERNLDSDLDRLRNHHRVDRLVSLMEGFEYGLLDIPELLSKAEQRGMLVHHLPIADGSVPTAAQVDEVDELVRAIRSALIAGDRVAVHCRGGQGRTGMIVAIVLTTFGHRPKEAIDLVRSAQPRAVENARQEEYVEEAGHRLAANNLPKSRRPARVASVGAIDRSRGALIGLAIGDALGTTLEFKRPGSFEPITDMVGGGPFSLKPGEWTDDTSMALCLAESLVEKAAFDPLDQMQRYVRWRRDGHYSVKGYCFDIGNATSAALNRFEQSGEPYSGSTDPYSAGNGSIMRLAPVAMAFANDPMEAIRLAGESSRTTHGAQTCMDACRYMAGLIVGAIAGMSKRELLRIAYAPESGAWDAEPLCDQVAEVAGGSFLRKEPPEIRGSGYVVESLEAALWAFANSDSFEQGALLAVNLGDDADTTGAVYGQIAGAYYGAGAIPPRWIERLAMREQIERLARGLIALAG